MGYRCAGVWDSPGTVAHVYAVAGDYSAKVIAERGGHAAESRATVAVREPCGFTLAPTSAVFAWGAASGSLEVGTQPWCAWAASTGEAWIHIVAGAGTGDGTVRFTLDANTASAPRTGVISVAGQSFSVTKAGLRRPRARLRS